MMQRCFGRSLRLSVFLAGIGILHQRIHAVVTESTTANLDGTFTYTYAVDNSLGALPIANWSLDFNFLQPDWNQLNLEAGGDVTVPNANWVAVAGTPVTGLSAQDFLTLSTDGDVAAGDRLNGFSFTSHFAPGTVVFTQFTETGEVAASDLVPGPSGTVVTTVPDVVWGIEAISFAAVTSFGLWVRIRNKS